MSETILTMDDRLPKSITSMPKISEEELNARPNMTPRLRNAAYDGYWQPGWEICHYLKQSPKVKGWESLIMWGPKSSYKSNRAAWLNWIIYEDFEIVWEYFVMDPLYFVELIRTPQRIPQMVWDDIASNLPSTLYFDNRPLYTKIKSYWWLLRTKISNFVCSAPVKSAIAGFVLDDMTSEMKCSPRGNFNYDRWSWSIDVKNPKRVKSFPINIHTRRRFNYKYFEYAQILNEETRKLEPDPRSGIWFPKKEWDRYWDMRLEFTERGGSSLETIMVEAFSEPPDVHEIVESAVKNNKHLQTDEEVLAFMVSKAAKITGLNSAWKRDGDPKTREKMWNLANDLNLLQDVKQDLKA